MITSSPGFQFTGVADIVLRRELQRIEHSQDFVEVASAAHRIDQHQFDFLIRADDEDGANRRIVSRCASLAAFTGFSRQHVVKFRNFQLWIADHRIGHFVTLRFLDIRSPFPVIVHSGPH